MIIHTKKMGVLPCTLCMVRMDDGRLALETEGSVPIRHPDSPATASFRGRPSLKHLPKRKVGRKVASA